MRKKTTQIIVGVIACLIVAALILVLTWRCWRV